MYLITIIVRALQRDGTLMVTAHQYLPGPSVHRFVAILAIYSLCTILEAFTKIKSLSSFIYQNSFLPLLSCLNNYMPNNQFKRGELYSFITGKASTAIGRRLQKNFKQCAIEITIEQWSVLYHLWKQDGLSQQQLCEATFRDKPSITRLMDNLEKLKLVKRVASKEDRRINLIYLTKDGLKLQDKSMQLANQTLNEALDGVSNGHIDIAKQVLQIVYDNLK